MVHGGTEIYLSMHVARDKGRTAQEDGSFQNCMWVNNDQVVPDIAKELNIKNLVDKGDEPIKHHDMEIHLIDDQTTHQHPMTMEKQEDALMKPLKTTI